MLHTFTTEQQSPLSNWVYGGGEGAAFKGSLWIKDAQCDIERTSGMVVMTTQHTHLSLPLPSAP